MKENGITSHISNTRLVCFFGREERIKKDEEKMKRFLHPFTNGLFDEKKNEEGKRKEKKRKSEGN